MWQDSQESEEEAETGAIPPNAVVETTTVAESRVEETVGQPLNNRDTVVATKSVGKTDEKYINGEIRTVGRYPRTFLLACSSLISAF